MTGGTLSRIGQFVRQSALLSHAVEIEIAGEHFRADSTSCRDGARYVDYDYAWLAALAVGRTRIMDVGGGFGFTALLFSRRMGPDGRCLLVDMSMPNLESTTRNLWRAGMADRAQLIYARIGAHPALTERDLDAYKIPTAKSVKEAISNLRRVHGAAKETTIDVLSDGCAFRPELIKIDVEGAEQAALAGAVRTVDRWKPLIQVELHSFPPMTMRENAHAVLAWCSERGYTMWYLSKAKRVTDADELSSRGRCHVLLVPGNAEYPAVLRGIAQGSDAT